MRMHAADPLHIHINIYEIGVNRWFTCIRSLDTVWLSCLAQSPRHAPTHHAHLHATTSPTSDMTAAAAMDYYSSCYNDRWSRPYVGYTTDGTH